MNQHARDQELRWQTFTALLLITGGTALGAWFAWPPVGSALMAIAGGSQVYVQPEKILGLWITPFTLWCVSLTALLLASLLLALRPRRILSIAGLAFVAAIGANIAAAVLLSLVGVSATFYSAWVVIFTGFPLVAAAAAALTSYVLQNRIARRHHRTP
ncbi:hypothetical protein [Agromyces italicus]|uniref:hypothetical protein n=1 Tax=Agromyces italicus TaxID=279572 RepID=UPI0003B69E11|nr:hypothetical protein [Agromyces italicus]